MSLNQLAKKLYHEDIRFKITQRELDPDHDVRFEEISPTRQDQWTNLAVFVTINRKEIYAASDRVSEATASGTGNIL